MAGLTATQVDGFKKTGKLYRKSDRDKLYLCITASGKKYWEYRLHKSDGSRSYKRLGAYSKENFTLADARKEVASIESQLFKGKDPFEVISDESIDDLPPRTFTEVFQEFCELKTNEHSSEWNEDTFKKHDLRFNKHVLPALGKRPFSEVNKKDLTAVLEKILETGTDSNFRKVKTVLNMLFGWAESKEYTDLDYARLINMNSFRKLKASKNHKHVATSFEFEPMVYKVQNIKATYIVKQCLKIALHVFTRPKELVDLRWDEINWDKRFIEIPEHRMKMKRSFIIPLSVQVEKILSEVKDVTGHSDYVFLSPYRAGDKRPVSRDSLSNALRTNGIKETSTHGFRHAASSLLRDVVKADSDAVELQLSHAKGQVEGVYNKAQMLDERFVMMQAWSDYIDRVIVGQRALDVHE